MAVLLLGAADEQKNTRCFGVQKQRKAECVIRYNKEQTCGLTRVGRWFCFFSGKIKMDKWLCGERSGDII